MSRQRTKLQNEIWEAVVGYETSYEVSNFGRVKSLSRFTRHESRRGKEFWFKTKEFILQNVATSIGYPQVTLHKNGKQICRHIHRLVALAFIPNPKNKPQVNHIDGNKANNFLDNLEWVTPSEQMRHAYQILGVISYGLGKFGGESSKSRAVLQKTLLGKLVKRWESGVDAVREGGFDSGSITRCCRGQSKKHKGYVWRYV